MAVVCIACGLPLTELEAYIGNECQECHFALHATADLRADNSGHTWPNRPETIRQPVGDHALDRAHKEIQKCACIRLGEEQRKNSVLFGFLALTAPIALLGLIAIIHQILK